MFVKKKINSIRFVLPTISHPHNYAFFRFSAPSVTLMYSILSPTLIKHQMPRIRNTHGNESMHDRYDLTFITPRKSCPSTTYPNTAKRPSNKLDPEGVNSDSRNKKKTCNDQDAGHIVAHSSQQKAASRNLDENIPDLRRNCCQTRF
jgi:hypothetical protein